MTTITQSLDAAARLVEARLGDLLASIAGPPAPSRLIEAMRHGTLGAGKRFRPFLVLETAGLFDVPLRTALDAAAAVELVHCYSLVHDDLPAMDNDDLRRGRPTVHRAFDDWTAILAGDALLTFAFEVLGRGETHPDPAVRAELVLALAKAAGAQGMAGGQALDLAAERLGGSQHATAANIRALQSMKTGALIEVSCEFGAILAKADAAARSALKAYGAALGVAFQIADDLLDAEGEAAVVGKAVAKDAAAGKATLVSLLGIAGARAELAVAESAAIAALDRFGARAEGLRRAARFAAARPS